MNSINCVIYLYNSQYIWDKLKFVKERTTGKVQFRILRSFLVVLTKFSFWGGANEHWAIILRSFEIFVIFPNFLGSKSQVVRHLMRQLVDISLLLIITLRLTCADRKIYSLIKKSQNIINTIVGQRYTMKISIQSIKSIKIY